MKTWPFVLPTCFNTRSCVECHLEEKVDADLCDEMCSIPKIFINTTEGNGLPVLIVQMSCSRPAIRNIHTYICPMWNMIKTLLYIFLLWEVEACECRQYYKLSIVQIIEHYTGFVTFGPIRKKGAELIIVISFLRLLPSSYCVVKCLSKMLEC